MPQRRIVLFIACSLDGYIAGPNGELDWLFHDADYGYGDFVAGVDTVIMGRKTLDTVLGFGAYPYAGMQGFVYSRTRLGEAAKGAVYTQQRPPDLVSRLRAEEGRDVWLVGGGEVIRAFLADDLVDCLRLFVHPVLLGAGVPLFPSGFPRRDLRTTGHQAFPGGLQELCFERVAEP